MLRIISDPDDYINSEMGYDDDDLDLRDFFELPMSDENYDSFDEDDEYFGVPGNPVYYDMATNELRPL